MPKLVCSLSNCGKIKKLSRFKPKPFPVACAFCNLSLAKCRLHTCLPFPSASGTPTSHSSLIYHSKTAVEPASLFLETHSTASQLLLTARQLRERASPTCRLLLAFFFFFASFLSNCRIYFFFLIYYVNPACDSTTQAHTRMNKEPRC